MNLQMRVHVLRKLVTHLLIHMHHKENIELEITVKIACERERITSIFVAVYGADVIAP